MDKTCCPHYTIKMSALDFRMNKSHKKIIKQVNKYLIHGIKPGDSKNTAPDDVRDAPHTESGNVPEGETPTIDSKEKTKSENNESISTTQSEKPATENENAMETSQSDVKEKKPVKKGMKRCNMYNCMSKYFCDCRGHDRMVVGFTTTCANSA